MTLGRTGSSAGKARRANAVLALLLAAPLAAQVPFEAEVRSYEEADRLRPPPKGAELFIGSSSIALWSSLAEDFPGRAVVNRGFGGARVADCARHARRLVSPHEPRRVLLYAGDNDIAEGRTPQQVLADVRAFVAQVRADLPEAEIVFLSIKPSPARRAFADAQRAANALVRDWTRGRKGLAYADLWTPLIGVDGAPRPELFLPDGLHLNRQGYARWAAALRPVLRP